MINQQMICRTCPDRNRVASAASDANRILQHMKRMLPMQSRPARQSFQSAASYFDSHVSCRFTGNSCDHFRHEKRSLESAENELNACFVSMLAEPSIEISSLYPLFRLLCGHYPQAAKQLEKEMAKRKKTKSSSEGTNHEGD